MYPIYKYYRDHVANLWIAVDLDEKDLLKKSINNKPRGKQTLPLDDIEQDITIQLWDVVYYKGGYDGTGNQNSQHNRYAADEPDFGRDAPSIEMARQFGHRYPVGLPGAFKRAKDSATVQTTEWTRWVFDHLEPCLREEIFDYRAAGTAHSHPRNPGSPPIPLF